MDYVGQKRRESSSSSGLLRHDRSVDVVDQIEERFDQIDEIIDRIDEKIDEIEATRQEPNNVSTLKDDSKGEATNIVHRIQTMAPDTPNVASNEGPSVDLSDIYQRQMSEVEKNRQEYIAGMVKDYDNDDDEDDSSNSDSDERDALIGEKDSSSSSSSRRHRRLIVLYRA